MPETTETVANPADIAAQDAPIEATPDADKWEPERAKALIDKLRDEVKQLKGKAKRADELEAAESKRKESELSEVERLKRQLDEATERLTTATRREMQREAADAAKLPAEFASRLVGSNLEEMVEDAKKLAAAMPKQPALNPTNPGNGSAKPTDAQMRAFLYGGAPMPK